MIKYFPLKLHVNSSTGSVLNRQGEGLISFKFENYSMDGQEDKRLC